jgi:superfamily II DNA/RNA helicase
MDRMTFNELELDPNVLKAIDEAGYKEPTPIQAQAIPYALQGRDVLGIAQTGTGKTASFTLPMITILAKGRARARMPRSLILCPTRELAAQVAENFEIYGKHVKLSMALLIGGVSFKDQDKLIDRGVDVLIATPGRLLDHFERGKLMMTGIEIMVVDEADRMLDMGFIPDIERIFKLTPFTRQTLFFSATMPPEITRLTQEFLHNPERIEVAPPATTAETVAQKVCCFRASRKDRADKEKREVLRRLIKAEGDAVNNAIVFCNRKRDVDIVFKSLRKHDFNVAALHGDLDQSVRMQVLDGFRAGDIQILIASDVAARGLDIPNVSHIYNFDVPIHSEDYVHRIGRTGRAGRTGKAFTLCLPFEEKHLDKIETLVGQKIERIPSPLGEPAEDDRAEQAAAEEAAKPRRRSRRGGAKGREEPVVEAQPVEAAAPTAAPREEMEKPKQRGRSRGRKGREDDRDEPVVGMGDHVPAFLMRPVFDKKKSAGDEAPKGNGGSDNSESHEAA